MDLFFLIKMVFNFLTLEIGQNSGLLRRDPSRDFACIYLSMIKPEFASLDVAGNFSCQFGMEFATALQKAGNGGFSCA